MFTGETQNPSLPTSPSLKAKSTLTIHQALFAIRNFHSLTAILDGLRKYSLTESTMATAGNGADTVALKSVTPPSLLELLDPTDNFATYRQLYQASPGIPFLFPHIRECQQGGQPPLRQLFQQMQPIMD